MDAEKKDQFVFLVLVLSFLAAVVGFGAGLWWLVSILVT